MNKNILIVSMVLLTLILAGCDELIVDIMPGTYPNMVNINSKGMVPVAVLGTETFDVFDLDPTSFVYSDYGITNVRWHYEDVCTLLADGSTQKGPDGYIDLVFQYDMQQILAAAQANNLVPADGEVLTITLVGNLKTGESVNGADEIIVTNKSKK